MTLAAAISILRAHEKQAAAIARCGNDVGAASWRDISEALKTVLDLAENPS